MRGSNARSSMPETTSAGVYHAPSPARWPASASRASCVDTGLPLTIPASHGSARTRIPLGGLGSSGRVHLAWSADRTSHRQCRSLRSGPAHPPHLVVLMSDTPATEPDGASVGFADLGLRPEVQRALASLGY